MLDWQHGGETPSALGLEIKRGWQHGGETPSALGLKCQAGGLGSQAGVWGGGQLLKQVSWDGAGPDRYLHRWQHPIRPGRSVAKSVLWWLELLLW